LAGLAGLALTAASSETGKTLTAFVSDLTVGPVVPRPLIGDVETTIPPNAIMFAIDLFMVAIVDCEDNGRHA
jgi:hypothetical protein